MMSSGYDTRVVVSIIRRKNVRPGGTTFAAKDKTPMRDCNSLFVHVTLVSHLLSSVWMVLSFSGGSLASNFIVSRRMQGR